MNKLTAIAQICLVLSFFAPISSFASIGECEVKVTLFSDKAIENELRYHEFVDTLEGCIELAQNEADIVFHSHRHIYKHSTEASYTFRLIQKGKVSSSLNPAK